MNIRVHNTGHGSKKNLRRNLKNREQRVSDKPIGFWYGFRTSWHKWCRSEMPRWIIGSDYEVIVPSHLNILVLNSHADIFNFTDEYKINEKESFLENFQIDWVDVAEEYDGIEIEPYQHICRMDAQCRWYYSWDVASGCIWNAKDVTLKLIRKKNSNKSIETCLKELEELYEL